MKAIRTTRESPAVERVRTARRTIAKACNFDMDKLGQMLLERQGKSKQKFITPTKKIARD